MENEFDFGFTFGDSDSSLPPVPQSPSQPSIDEEDFDEFKIDVITRLETIDDKLASLVSGDIQQIIEQHKELLTAEVHGKLQQVEQLILPLLYNLKKNPDKEYIHWPNRTEVIDKQINKILTVTRSYGKN